MQSIVLGSLVSRRIWHPVLLEPDLVGETKIFGSRDGHGGGSFWSSVEPDPLREREWEVNGRQLRERGREERRRTRKVCAKYLVSSIMKNGRSPAFSPVIVAIFPAWPDEDVVAEKGRREGKERSASTRRRSLGLDSCSTYTSLQLLSTQTKR